MELSRAIKKRAIENENRFRGWIHAGIHGSFKWGSAAGIVSLELFYLTDQFLASSSRDSIYLNFHELPMRVILDAGDL